MYQNIKEYNLINSIINNTQLEQTRISKEGPQLLLEDENNPATLDAQRKKLELKKAEDVRKKAELAAIDARKRELQNEESDEGSSMSKEAIKEKIADYTQKIQDLQKKLDDGDDEESIDEDCPHTDGHDHNEDYCAMVKSQLSKLGQMSGMIHSMIPKGVDLPSEVKEKISSAVSNLSGAAAAMQNASRKQDDEEEKPAGMAPSSAPRRITTFNVRPVSAPQRMAGFSFNPQSTPSYEEYND